MGGSLVSGLLCWGRCPAGAACLWAWWVGLARQRPSRGEVLPTYAAILPSPPPIPSHSAVPQLFQQTVAPREIASASSAEMALCRLAVGREEGGGRRAGGPVSCLRPASRLLAACRLAVACALHPRALSSLAAVALPHACSFSEVIALGIAAAAADPSAFPVLVRRRRCCCCPCSCCCCLLCRSSAADVGDCDFLPARPPALAAPLPSPAIAPSLPACLPACPQVYGSFGAILAANLVFRVWAARAQPAVDSAIANAAAA